jgi:hypothetical protein
MANRPPDAPKALVDVGEQAAAISSSTLIGGASAWSAQ